MRTGTRSPGLRAASTVCRAVTEGVGRPAALTMMSPVWMPALAAAPPGATLATPTPVGCPLASATVSAVMPSDARVTALAGAEERDAPRD